MENTLQADTITGYVRAYSKPVRVDGRSRKRTSKKKEINHMGTILPVYPFQTLTFDTETMVTPDKTLLYGFYMINGYNREDVMQMFLSGTLIPECRDVIREVGVFFNEEMLTPTEIEYIKDHARKTKLSEIGKLLEVNIQSVDTTLRVKTPGEFVTLMYNLARRENLLVIALNTPFDLSRLAKGWEEGTGKHKGSFVLKMKEGEPGIRIYHIGFAKNLYSLEQSRHMKNGKQVRDRDYEHLHFLDLSELSGSLLGPGAWSLHALGKTLNIPPDLRKLGRPERDYRPTPEKLAYALQDVIATYACYQRLRDLYEKHDLSDQTAIWNLVSGASLGKAYLKKIGIRSFEEQHPDFPKEIIGYAMNAFLGARSEVAVRLKPVRGRLRDYTSEYPLVCSLLGLQRYWLAQNIAVNQGSETLDKVNTIISKSVPELLDFLHDPQNWKDLVILCKVRPNGNDRFPVRANYGALEDERESATTTNIALPYVSSDVDLWYCIQDVIASKLLTGNTPEVIGAIELVASQEQYTVHPIKIMGDDDALIDLTSDEFFTRVIDLKQEYGDKADKAKKEGDIEGKEYNGSIKTALKLLANSTSYGSLVEIRVSEPEDDGKEREVSYYDGDGKECHTMVSRVETTGQYFSPLGPFITASGRLMLAISERLGLDAGFGLIDEDGFKSVFAFCDTDSMFYICPDDMDWSTFIEKDKAIGEWFQALSPYQKNAEVFKLEIADAYCFGISAKRYCLYTIREEEGRRIPVMLKVSSHGLGAIQNPYKNGESRGLERSSIGSNDIMGLRPKSQESPFPEIPPPSSDLKVSRWIYDLFYRAVYALENGIFLGIEDKDISRVQFHPITKAPDLTFSTIGLTEICQHQITLSSPHLLKTYEKIGNLLPFSFFTVFPNVNQSGLLRYRAKLEDENSKILERRRTESTLPPNTLIPMKDIENERDIKIASYQELIKSGTPLYSGSTTTDVLWPIYRCDNNEPVPDYVQLKTVSEVLQKYFTHKEMKAANPGGCGVMRVRRVHITAIKYMGKEVSERLEETTEEALGLINDWRVLEYGSPGSSNPDAINLFIRKLKRYDMHDLMYTSGLSRKVIGEVLHGKVKPKTQTINALYEALSFIEGGGYDNTWRAYTSEHMMSVLKCSEKRAKDLLNGYTNFTEEEKASVENWGAALLPYDGADLAFLTGLSKRGIDKIKAGLSTPTASTKILLRTAMRTLDNTKMVWRKERNEVLSNLLGLPVEDVAQIKYGYKACTDEQRKLLLAV